MDEKNMERWSLWQRNVVDKFKDFSTEEIKENLKKNSPPLAILMAQIDGDFNFSNIIRTANSFGIVDIFYHGRKRFDKRGACGTHHYANLHHLTSFDEVKLLKSEYKFVGMENNREGTIRLNEFIWPKEKTLICLGEENSGINEEVSSLLDFMVEIPSYGSVRSLNVGSAAAIAIYDYFLKENQVYGN